MTIEIKPYKIEMAKDIIEAEIADAVKIHQSEEDLGVREADNYATTSLFPRIEGRIQMLNFLTGTTYWYNDSGLVEM